MNKLSIDLEQISEWADTQNEYITKTFRIDGKNTQGIPSKVWSCNGGGNGIWIEFYLTNILPISYQYQIPIDLPDQQLLYDYYN